MDYIMIQIRRGKKRLNDWNSYEKRGTVTDDKAELASYREEKYGR